jgi:hypothetical protein
LACLIFSGPEALGAAYFGNAPGATLNHKTRGWLLLWDRNTTKNVFPTMGKERLSLPHYWAMYVLALPQFRDLYMGKSNTHGSNSHLQVFSCDLC